MPSEIQQRYIRLLIGATIMVAAILLFVVGLSKIVPFPPVTGMEYVIIIFGILGINFGMSSGKRLAYTIHDRDLILKRIKGQGRASTIIGNFVKLPIMFTAFTLIAWTILVIAFSLSKSVVVDTVLIGYVRWMLIFSMIVLITGSYIFYKARSYGKSHMLTLKGRIMMERSSKVVGEAMQRMDRAEEKGRNMAHQTDERGRELYHHVEDKGRGIVDRIEGEEKELVDRIKRKF